MLFDTVCIVGVGLIGGSFGIAIRERKLARQVIGLVRRKETINVAFQCGAVDNASMDVSVAARGADLIMLASPVGQMRALCQELAPVVRAGAIVTDAGSTKADVVEDCTRIFGQKALFVGGHPMAGSERTGVENARGNLFEKAVWVLTPTADTPEGAVNRLVELVEALGATPLLLDPELHDALLAVTSHLPHITAAALVHVFIGAQDKTEFAQQLIGGGWRDSTRVAAGSPEMWRDICLSNAPAIARGVNDLIEQLHELHAMLQDRDADRLSAWFEEASIMRRRQGYYPRTS